MARSARVRPAALAAFLAVTAATSAPVCAQDQRTFATIVLNGVTGGQSLVVVGDGDISIDATTLDALDIPHTAVPAQVIKGVTYVSLNALAPGVRYRFNAQTIELSLTLTASLLPRSSVSVAQQHPSGTRTSVRAATVNYALSQVQGQALGASFDARVATSQQHVFESTFGKSIFGGLARGLSTYTIDDDAHLRSTLLGDVVTTSQVFGGGAVIGGVAFRRAFDLDPYAIHFPVPRLTTTVTSPTVAQLYVNGTLVDTLQLQPGNYTLSDLPARVGYTNAQIVLVDTFGNTTSQNASFASSASLLRKGLNDYEFAAGTLRHDVSAAGDRYGGGAYSGFYRIGLSNALTVGAHTEGGVAEREGGIAASAISGNTIVLADADLSNESGIRGRAAEVALAEQGQRSSWSFSAAAQSRSFSTLVQRAVLDRQLLNVAFDASTRVSRKGSLSAGLSYGFDRDSGAVSRGSLTLTNSIGGFAVSASGIVISSLASGTRRLSPGFSVMVTRNVGGTAYTAVTSHDDSGTHTELTAQRTNTEHFGTSTSASVDGSTLRPATLSYDDATPYARVDASLTRDANGRYVPAGFVNGAVTIAARDVFFTQPVTDAGVVVVTPGLKRVPVDMDGLVVGYTDARGKAFVPFGRSNEPNSVDVAEQSLPENLELARGSIAVVPSRRNVALAEFSVSRIHSVTGFILAPNDPYAGGTLRIHVGARDLDLPLDESARFYIDDIAAGTYDATAVAGSQSCKVVVRVPEFQGMRFSLGPIPCASP